MPLVCGGVVPHAPLLLEWVAGEKVGGAAEEVKAAFEHFRSGGRWDLGAADVLVVVSSHGSTTGVFGSIEGSLEPFGSGLPALEAPGDPEAAVAIANSAGLPLLSGPVDHGVVVPLLLLLEVVPELAHGDAEALSPVRFPPIVAVAHAESGPDPLAFGRAVAEATRQLATDRSVAFLASAHTGAGLSPRAPLTELEASKAFDDRLLGALRADVGDISSIPLPDWEVAGSCGAGPFIAFGELFSGNAAEVAAYESPFGVGYLVAGIGRGGREV